MHLLRSEIETLSNYANGADASFLCQHLQAAHWGKPCFAIVPEAMAAACVIPHWGEWRYRSARKTALAAGILEQVKRGGKGPGDPSLFAFKRPR